MTDAELNALTVLAMSECIETLVAVNDPDGKMAFAGFGTPVFQALRNELTHRGVMAVPGVRRSHVEHGRTGL